MPGRLEGKVAIITGGGGGFGKAIAEKFVSEGAKVIIVDMIEDVGKKTADELKCEFFKGNVTKREDWEEVLKLADEKNGAVDVVVNNAGTTYRQKSTLEVTDEDFDKIMAVNVKSLYYSANTIVPYMQKKGGGGSFITIASTASLRPRPNFTWYNASKWAVLGATRTMAIEFGKDNVRFNSVCPGVSLETGLSELFLGKPENEKAMLSTVPLGRASSPKDVANACCYLASDEAQYVTGIEIPVDGGRCA